MTKLDEITSSERMLYAVNALTMNIQGTPEEQTKEFWEAFPAFANEYLVGAIVLVEGSTVTAQSAMPSERS